MTLKTYTLPCTHDSFCVVTVETKYTDRPFKHLRSSKTTFIRRKKSVAMEVIELVALIDC